MAPPLHQVAAVMTSPRHPPAPDRVPGRRILLVDDEIALLIPLSRYFRNLGCEVDVAEEPEIAEALLDHRRYDVVIIDLRLTPFGNAEGLEVLRGLRRRDHWT